VRILRRISLVLLLALIFLLRFSERPDRHAKGFLVDVPTVCDNCGETYSIVATLVGNHQVKLSEESSRLIAEAVVRLKEVLKFRSEKLVYVKAVADIDFGEFAELVDALSPEVQVISLFSPRVEALVQGHCCLVPSCGNCEIFLWETSLMRFCYVINSCDDLRCPPRVSMARNKSQLT
jgi:hypothetical protein